MALLWRLPAQRTAPELPQTAVRLSFGWRDAAPRSWNGRVQVAGGRLARIDGYRFGPNDSVAPEGRWRLTSGPSLVPAREVWPGAACALEDDSRIYQDRHPSPVAGVLLYLDGNPSALRLSVETDGGNFEIAPGELRLGRPLAALDGHAQAELVPPAAQVDGESPEQDHPALAASPDGALWLAYQSYSASRHEDRIFLARFHNGRWDQPRDVAGPGNYYRPQVAVDGVGRVWVVWAALVGEDWDLFARRLENGAWSSVRRVTSAPGSDFNHRLAAGPDGALWLAWQANRAGNWDILLAQLRGDAWTPPAPVTAGPENDWEPALAVTRDGRVAVAWDSHRRGSYNVYMRIRSASGEWQPEMPVASGEDYEAHASLAVDREDRIWIAWDNGGPAWGLDSACNGLYRHRHIDVRAWANGAWQMPLVKPMRDLPPALGRFVSLPQVAFDAQGRLWMFFRHWTNRQVYELYAMSLTRDGWSAPVLAPHSTGREYQLPAWALAADGRLWAAWASDGSQPRRPQEKHYSVYAAPLPAPAEPPEWPLQRGTPPLDITVALPSEPARYTTTVVGKQMSVYWGDLHRHTDLSSHRFTDGSLEDTYRYGADAARLDFLAPTDHVTVGTPTVENIRGDDYHWWRIQKAADLMHRAGRFVPIYAYERSMQTPGGHRNLLYARRGAVPIPGNIKDPRDKPTSLWERLAGQEVIVTPHTPADAMQPLIRWDYKKPDFEPLLEIYQGLRSSYEYYNAPLDGRLGGTQTDEPGHFLQDALAKGLRYGVQASSDHLATHINYTGVYAEELSRAALFRAMKARHTFAASDKILVDFRMGGYFMGDELRAATPAPVEVKVIGTAAIRSVEIIRNNRVIHAVAPDANHVEFRYRDSEPLAGEAYYYVRVIQRDGNMAWSSPIWVVP